MITLIFLCLFISDQKIAEVSPSTPGYFEYDAIQRLCEKIRDLPADELPSNMENLAQSYSEMNAIVMAATKDGSLDEASAALMFYNVNGIFLSDTFSTTKQLENQITVLKLALRYAKDTSWELNVLGNLAYAYLYLGNTEMAIHYFEETLTLPTPIRNVAAHHTGNIRQLAKLYQKIGDDYQAMKRYELSFKKMKAHGAELHDFHKEDLETYIALAESFGYSSDDPELVPFMTGFVSHKKGYRFGKQHDDLKTMEKSYKHDTRMLARNFRRIHYRK